VTGATPAAVVWPLCQKGGGASSHLFEHVHDELLVDPVDAHAERLALRALAEVARAHQADERPAGQALLTGGQLHLVVLVALLHPAAPHRLRQLTQEVLDLLATHTKTLDLTLFIKAVHLY